jgi:hypothetical protein
MQHSNNFNDRVKYDYRVGYYGHQIQTQQFHFAHVNKLVIYFSVFTRSGLIITKIFLKYTYIAFH